MDGALQRSEGNGGQSQTSTANVAYHVAPVLTATTRRSRVDQLVVGEAFGALRKGGRVGIGSSPIIETAAMHPLLTALALAGCNEGVIGFSIDFIGFFISNLLLLKPSDVLSGTTTLVKILVILYVLLICY